MDEPDDPNPTPSPDVASDHPGGGMDPVEPEVERPRLRRPAAFRAARERIRQRDAWLALPEEERARRLAAQANHEQDVRAQHVRNRLLELIDDGRVAQALHAAAQYMSRRCQQDA